MKAINIIQILLLGSLLLGCSKSAAKYRINNTVEKISQVLIYDDNYNNKIIVDKEIKKTGVRISNIKGGIGYLKIEDSEDEFVSETTHSFINLEYEFDSDFSITEIRIINKISSIEKQIFVTSVIKKQDQKSNYQIRNWNSGTIKFKTLNSTVRLNKAIENKEDYYGEISMHCELDKGRKVKIYGEFYFKPTI